MVLASVEVLAVDEDPAIVLRGLEKAIVHGLVDEVRDLPDQVVGLDEYVHRICKIHVQDIQHRCSEPARNQSLPSLCPVLFHGQNWRLSRHPILHCGS